MEEEKRRRRNRSGEGDSHREQNGSRPIDRRQQAGSRTGKNISVAKSNNTDKKARLNRDLKPSPVAKCPVSRKCGGCDLQGKPYREQLAGKQKYVEELLGDFGEVNPIIGMEDPKYYRNKVHHVFARDRKGNILSGCYEEHSHRVVNIDECMLEDKRSQEIIGTVKSLLHSFKIFIYDEDTDRGLLRHVLVRRAFATGEIMVVLVVTSPIFPSKNNFVKALRDKHPDITTVVLNINDKDTSMVLGERNITLYGPGFIRDTLCGCSFRISPDSFYQINPVQTEKLYKNAIEYAGLTGRETIIDAYCGIGTIGLVASKKASHVIGVELNGDAVKDAVINCKENKITNAEFYKADAGDFMAGMADSAEHADVVFMDPPRSGSTEKFMDAVAKLAPDRVVYVSCDPSTQARDIKYFAKLGYHVRRIQPVDMFPATRHVETVCLLSKKAPV